MDDLIDEELAMMEEQAQDIVLSGEIFSKELWEMQIPKVVSVEKHISIGEAIQIMQDNKMGSVVVSEGGKVVGIVTERDILLKVVNKITDTDRTSVAMIMTPNPVLLRPNDMITFAMHNMHIGGFRHVPIVDDNGKALSMVSIKDVLSFLLDHFPQIVANTTAEPYRGPVSRDGG